MNDKNDKAGRIEHRVRGELLKRGVPVEAANRSAADTRRAYEAKQKREDNA